MQIYYEMQQAKKIKMYGITYQLRPIYFFAQSKLKMFLIVCKYMYTFFFIVCVDMKSLYIHKIAWFPLVWKTFSSVDFLYN